jgi:hypothetical protein
MSGEWRVMSDTPERPMTCVGWSATVAEAMGWSPLLTSGGRDERFSLIFWDGNDWCHLGSAHELYEDGDDPRLPTHWQPLTPPCP